MTEDDRTSEKTLDWRELLAKTNEQEERRLEKIVEAGEAESIDEARRKTEEEAKETYSRIHEHVKANLDVGEKARRAVLDSLDFQERMATGIGRLHEAPVVKFPPMPDITPMPVVIQEAVGELIRKTDERMDFLEAAVDRVRNEQEEQGKRSRKLRKTLWGWGIAVSALLATLSFLLGWLV